MQFAWRQLPVPFIVLAPMEDVTDTVFRQIIMSIGKPDVLMSEFTNCEGILHSQGSVIVSQRLVYNSRVERPLIAQIWGNRPESFFKVAQKLAASGFDGIDINMGCPVAAVMRQQCGSALIDKQALVSEIVAATKEGKGSLPLSIKTRIGVKSVKTESWISHLLSLGIDALTVHGRTAYEQSLVPAHWDEIAKAVSIRNAMGVETVIIGNGDVSDRIEALEKHAAHHVDGVMIGRGIFKNPWAFTTDPRRERSVADRLSLLLTHLRLFESTWGTKKHFPIMKKFFKMYVNGYLGASELRASLMACTTSDQVLSLIEPLINTNRDERIS